jgi:hypothetical protein
MGQSTKGKKKPKSKKEMAAQNLEVTPEFLKLTEELDKIGDKLDALKAEQNKLKPAYKEISEKVTDYIVKNNLPRLDSATGRSSLGRHKKKQQHALNKSIVQQAVKKVIPAATEAQLEQLWPVINELRFKGHIFVLDRKVYNDDE